MADPSASFAPLPVDIKYEPPEEYQDEKPIYPVDEQVTWQDDPLWTPQTSEEKPNPSVDGCHVGKCRSSKRKCCVCDMWFSNTSAIASHYLNVHKLGWVKDHYTCCACKKTFSQESNTNSHVVGRPNLINFRLDFSCEVCHKPFGSAQDVARHHRNTHEDSLSTCASTSEDIKLIAKDTATPPQQPSKEPTKHWKVYKKLKSRVFPKLNSTYAKKQFICRICSKSFTSSKSLQSHIVRHSESNLEIDYDKNCTAETLVTRQNFLTEENPLMCGLCGNCFVCRKDFWVHTCGKESEKEPRSPRKTPQVDTIGQSVRKTYLN